MRNSDDVVDDENEGISDGGGTVDGDGNEDNGGSGFDEDEDCIGDGKVATTGGEKTSGEDGGFIGSVEAGGSWDEISFVTTLAGIGSTVSSASMNPTLIALVCLSISSVVSK